MSLFALARLGISRMVNNYSKCTVMEPCQTCDTVKTSQKLRIVLVAHDHNRTRQLSHSLFFVGKGAITFRLHPCTLITVPLHVSRSTRPSSTHALIFTIIIFAQSGEGLGTRLSQSQVEICCYHAKLLSLTAASFKMASVSLPSGSDRCL